MKVVAMKYQGVRKLVPVEDAQKLNDLKKLGYKPCVKDGAVEIFETSVQSTYDGILDQDIKNALLEAEKKDAVNKKESAIK